MPSAEETTPLFKVMPETTQDFVTRDVDLLVSEIKENLRLSGLKAKSSVTTRNRPSPYLPLSRNEFRKKNIYEIRMKHLKNNNNDKTEEDPYLQLRELIKQGRLINEAVKKLQNCNFEDLSNSEDENDDHEIHDNNDVHIHRGYRRKTYYYDSEDEPLPAVYGSLDL